MNFKDAEFIQYLFPPFSIGPSSKTCPKWDLAILLLSSVLTIPWEVSLVSSITSSLIVFVNEGQPQPESNLSKDVKRGSPLIIST